MDMLALTVSARDKTMKNGALRRTGKVPCVVYGSEVKDLLVQCDVKDLHKTFVKAGESTLVELDMDGRKIPVLFKQIQFHPVSDIEIHADFYAVNMKQEIETMVPVHVEGESPAVKDQAGILVIVRDSITVRCLPKDLPHNLVVNISLLVNFHDVITVKDMKIPNGVKVMHDPSTVIATVQEPRAEEVITPVAAVPAEGEAAAAAGAPAAEGAAPAADAAAAKSDEKAAKGKK